MSPALRLPSALACGLLFASCLFRNDNTETLPIDNADTLSIVPLAVGNSWTYVDSAYYGGDSVAVDSARTVITGTKTVTVAGAAHTVYLANDIDRATGLPRALTTYLQNRGDGLYTMGAAQDGAEHLTQVLHVAYPAQEGRRYPTWFITFAASASPNGAPAPVLDTVEIEVADAGLSCTVPAGTFACVRYRGWRGAMLHATGYYAPGVGNLGSEIVRTLEVDGAPREVVFTRRLTAFTLH